MSEASKRTSTWREQKREEGYQPVTFWMPGRIKELMVKLAFEQHHDLGVEFTEAAQAHVQAKGVKPSTVLDRRWVEALIDQKIAHALASHSPALTPPPAPHPPLPEGMRWCRKKLHQVPVGKPECPQCVTLRKRKSRKGQTAKRRGALPT